MLFTVVGSSCSGKTAAARAVEALAAGTGDGLVVHDFDEIGVPPGAGAGWRHRATEAWIRRALEYQAAGVDVLLTGQSPLGEVLACPSATALDGIAACLIDVADPVRLRRLEERDPEKWDDRTKEAFLGWAQWLRGHAADPQHRPEAITAAGGEDMRWSRWSAWSGSDPRWAVPTIDTTGRTIEETALVLHSWITGARRARLNGHLPLAPGWADHHPPVPR
ncbi:hypothetical protein [Actinoplanes couchii]|uniref:Uncharacterized protein n=1 Tax=Actinoplanes couchii TaxID=403638 RepID=A0ABQ3XPI2_9ACTN|nr:hypothetical protein [Actinoplanes couchii]MDR6319071.1 hypothetical protein [Actinoplanes couchii]GID60414.1 hypothetical protein Aco03nite_088180 [Actinoplanes couchii]